MCLAPKKPPENSSMACPYLLLFEIWQRLRGASQCATRAVLDLNSLRQYGQRISDMRCRLTMWFSRSTGVANLSLSSQHQYEMTNSWWKGNRKEDSLTHSAETSTCTSRWLDWRTAPACSLYWSGPKIGCGRDSHHAQAHMPDHASGAPEPTRNWQELA